MQKSRLLIISDTKIMSLDGHYFGFNAVVLEIELFKELFKTITWIGSDYNDYPMDESLLPMPTGVEIIALPIIGGKSFIAKIRSIRQGLKYLLWAIKKLPSSDVIHVRGPNAVSFLVLFLAPFYRKKTWWFKYANNWVDANAGFTWKVQRFLLKRFSFLKVSVNGKWPSDPKHIVPLENPCLINDELVIHPKSSNKGFRLLFVGRIEIEKGIVNFLNVINGLNDEYLDKIIEVNIIGDGPEIINVIQLAKVSRVKINVLGKLSKDLVLKMMSESNYLVLPSVASEGFPKVIAEAWSMGCIPITTDVSSIGQYVINGLNGFVFSTDNVKKNLHEALIRALCLPVGDFENMVVNSESNLRLFTYNHYKKQILDKIICVV